MRTLLNVRTGVTGFEDLKTIRDGDGIEYIFCANFKEACQKLGLYHDDTEWDKVMEKANTWGFVTALRIHANILSPSTTNLLLDKHQYILT